MNLSHLADFLPGIFPPDDIYYRLVNVQYVSEMDEIIHSIHYSGRYNPKGEFGVLYLAISLDCAFREKLRQVYGRKGDLPPQRSGAFSVSMRCLDLRQNAILKRLEISKQDLINPADYTIPQTLAREARKLGFEGILAPSAIGDNCHNLVVFKDKLNPPSHCILDPKSIRPYPH